MQGKAFLGAVSLLLSAGVAANSVGLTEVKLRTEASVPYCTFDRSVSMPRRTGNHTLVGEFAVQCQEYATPYRLTTTLSPFAQLNKGEDYTYAVRWYVRPSGLACEGDTVHPDAVMLHSGSRDAELIGPPGKKAWSYCVQLRPLVSMASDITDWPLHGQLPLTLVDAAHPAPLPDDALRFHVNFDHNSSTLTPGALQLIDALVQATPAPWDYHVQLHAHASLVGDEAYNHQLTLMRLKRVREYLIDQHGIRKGDTWGQAWGDTRPMALKTPEDEDTQNRRVDIVLIPKRAARVGG